uniref:Proteasome alpha-type subunits domain-containing protein n=1 Tax=Corethron hystrix TaxID=216773 RepID=A0A7S1FQW5_9STRA|mmetsp:Transcript_21564/g.49012  ORF Transcript_21564/g.49012 Transcript_21564/m.49012 type:complete len:394 (+) Transcript_21564:308-1489(+)|eukprot:CAMPEP_0113297398 /NCGR_PEP_ID=MMETSP0010_2-20120614/279_1 /TAXON_ID=216773 ORGANISM="Corethron hystrix, Strain 308" /NCGR_SAMPLE_ID=MMETSP0010_2 /ASSEMBLY_ACC=CAM_ASM_000155 /LENGTH=393 /DNA_ID=CAMNT_0000150285 /DNA_START=106 /DNA_END=1287 /DNA_ORIENTATION=- /assembly_acc=CAM_ASM_000155
MASLNLLVPFSKRLLYGETISKDIFHRGAAPLSLTLLAILFSFLLASSLPTITASSYSTYQYDTATSRFSPDGRLLQVEYAAIAAAGREEDETASATTPLVVIGCPGGATAEKDGPALIAGYARRHDRRLHTTRSPTDDDDIAGRHHDGRLGRIFSLPSSSSAILCASGILPDAYALVSSARNASARYASTYGASSKRTFVAGTTTTTRHPPLSFLADAIGDECRDYTSGYGLRPFGASLLMAGIEDGRVTLYRTVPGGAVLSYPEDAVVVMGGGSDGLREERIREELIAMLGRAGTDNIDSSKDGLKKMVDALTLVLLKELERGRKKTIYRDIDEEEKNDADSKINTDASDQYYPPLEIVIITQKDGIHTLDDRDIQVIIDRVRSQQSIDGK